MKFIDAYEHLKKGKLITLPEWSGYWKWNKDTNSIDIHCKDGIVMDIRNTEDLDYTLRFIISRDDWEVKDKDKVGPLGIYTFTFGEAIRRMKKGEKVRRDNWASDYYIHRF